MKRTVILLLILSSILSAYASEDEVFIPIQAKYDWTVSSGSPCKIIVKKGNYGSQTVYYFTPDGKMTVAVEERLDGPGSKRKYSYTDMYVLDDSYNTIGGKHTNYPYIDGGKVDTVITYFNNLEKIKKERVRFDYSSYNVINCRPEDLDDHGNWLKGRDKAGYVNYGNDVTRKIFYYGEDPQAEREAALVLAERDSLETIFKGNTPSGSEMKLKERKANHSFWWNILVPALCGALLSLPLYPMRLNRKRSSLSIILTNVALILIFIFIAKWLLYFGPYNGLWKVVFWLIFGMVDASIMHIVILAHRCPNPKCNSLNTVVLSKEYKTRTKHEVEINKRDNTAEIISTEEDRSTIHNMYCKDCGHRWREYFTGHV